MEFAGWRIEDGEAPEMAMRRELEEELTLKICNLIMWDTTYSEGSLVYRFFAKWRTNNSRASSWEAKASASVVYAR